MKNESAFDMFLQGLGSAFLGALITFFVLCAVVFFHKVWVHVNQEPQECECNVNMSGCTFLGTDPGINISN